MEKMVKDFMAGRRDEGMLKTILKKDQIGD